MVVDVANRNGSRRFPSPPVGVLTSRFRPMQNVVYMGTMIALARFDFRQSGNKDKGTAKRAFGLRFSPDGRHFVSISAGSCRFWTNRPSGVSLGTLYRQHGARNLQRRQTPRRQCFERRQARPQKSSVSELELIHEDLNLPAPAGSFAFSPGGNYLRLGS